MSAFGDVGSLAPQRIWDHVAGRSVHGERLTMTVVELDPGAVVAEHSHDHEQLGVVIRGSVDFRIGDERQELGPGGTWSIPSNVPHDVVAGPQGAVLIDVFAPVREEFRTLDQLEQRPPRWPGA
jgi:quercetin dioxygenase-like cupin family protein